MTLCEAVTELGAGSVLLRHEDIIGTSENILVLWH